MFLFLLEKHLVSTYQFNENLWNIKIKEMKLKCTPLHRANDAHNICIDGNDFYGFDALVSNVKSILHVLYKIRCN